MPFLLFFILRGRFNKPLFSVFNNLPDFLIIFVPVFIAIALKVTLYDDFRLFLFLIPFLSLFSALSVNFLLENFNKNIINKAIVFLTFLLFYSF